MFVIAAQRGCSGLRCGLAPQYGVALATTDRLIS
jgi:hypothetical protein